MANNPVAQAVDKFTSLKAAAEAKDNAGAKLDLGVSKETSFKVDPFIIQIRPGFNRPLDRQHIDSIKEAIRGGVKLKPIDVAVERTAEKSTIYMVDGEHRMWAVRELVEEFRAGLPSGRELGDMSAVEFKAGLDEQIAHMLSSGQGLAVMPLVQGEKYVELMNFGWDIAKIAGRMGKSTIHIENCLSLARAEPDLKAAIRAGEVASTAAVEIVREHGSDAGKVIKEALKATGKGKVTLKEFRGRAVPRKLVNRATESIGLLFDNLAIKPDELAAMGDSDKVSVDAGMLKELLAIRDEVAKLRAAPEAASEADKDAGNGA